MPHSRCWNALPWYVNGTLSGDDAAAVERHVGQCADCAAELQLQRAMQANVRDGDAVLMAPQSSWQKMVERLDREDEALARTTPRATALKWAVAAQALLIVGLIGAVWQQARMAEGNARLQPRYETLTSVQQAPVARGGVRVVFGREITVSEVNELLRDSNLQIVSGPTEAGVYTLARIGAADDVGAENLLKRLRADARVVFAEPDRAGAVGVDETPR